MLRALGLTPAEQLRWIRAGVASARPEIRRSAVVALGDLGAAAVDVLADLVDNPDFEVRAAVATALGRSADRCWRASSLLTLIATGDSHYLVRLRACEALDKLPPQLTAFRRRR